MIESLTRLREMSRLRDMINSTIHAARQLSLAGECAQALALIALCLVKISQSTEYANGNTEILNVYKRIQSLGKYIQYVMTDGKKCEEPDEPATLGYKVQEYYANIGAANQPVVVASATASGAIAANQPVVVASASTPPSGAIATATATASASGPLSHTGTFYSR